MGSSLLRGCDGDEDFAGPGSAMRNRSGQPSVSRFDQQVLPVNASKPMCERRFPRRGKGCRMAEQIHNALRHLEGHRVCLVLSDGTRILDAQLISAGRPGLSSVWILID